MDRPVSNSTTVFEVLFLIPPPPELVQFLALERRREKRPGIREFCGWNASDDLSCSLPPTTRYPSYPSFLTHARPRKLQSPPPPHHFTPRNLAMSELDLQAIHDFAVSLAQRAGAMISSASLSRSAQSSSTGADSSKKNRVDRELAPEPLTNTFR